MEAREKKKIFDPIPPKKYNKEPRKYLEGYLG